MNKSILPKLSRQLLRLLYNRTAILTDNLRGIGFDGEHAVYTNATIVANTVDCLILGKEHYSEQNRPFPIQSRRELKKILAMEAANSGEILLYRIGEYKDGQRNVICWTVNPASLAAHQLAPLLILPESALLLSRGENHLYSVARNGRQFWFIQRQGKSLCAEKRGLIANASMFLASAGLSHQIEQTELDTHHYLELLLAQLLPILLKNTRGFYSGLRDLDHIDWLKHLKFSGATASIILVGYFSLTSLYLNFRLEAAKSTAQAFSSQTKDVFELKDQLNQIEQKSAQLGLVSNHLSAPNVIWRFIVPLVQRGVAINQINLLPSGLYIIRAEADKATEVLEFIKGDPLVLEPQFRGQTAVVDNKERFEVAFKIKEA